MKISARPHINGNCPQDFDDAARKLFNAAHDFNVALSVLDEVFHGRNYQHLSDRTAKLRQQEDKLMLAELRDAAQRTTKLAELVLYAGKENL